MTQDPPAPWQKATLTLDNTSNGQKTTLTVDDTPSDDRPEALKLFKDWNERLLLTAVAALAWVVRDGLPNFCTYKSLGAASLAFSIAAGIVTLALLPIIQEQMKESQNQKLSIYEIRPRFWASENAPSLTCICTPFHLSFYLGILLYLCGFYFDPNESAKLSEVILLPDPSACAALWGI